MDISITSFLTKEVFAGEDFQAFVENDASHFIFSVVPSLLVVNVLLLLQICI